MNNINIQVYSSCNCDCSFCHFKDNKCNRINPDFVIDFLNNNLNYTKILLTGGEPTLAIKEYEKLIQGLVSPNRTLILQTNGWWGNNETIKNSIKVYPPSLVHLSVDSEKQKHIKLETAKNAYQFLIDNNIPVCVVNHTSNQEEFNRYSKIFPNLIKGKICIDDGINLYDCGTALLADHTISNLNIKGWRNK